VGVSKQNFPSEEDNSIQSKLSSFKPTEEFKTKIVIRISVSKIQKILKIYFKNIMMQWDTICPLWETAFPFGC
jgi:hypothetical protein